MNTITDQEVRPLSAEELDAVAGGMEATFSWGNWTMTVSVNDNLQIEVCTGERGTAPRCTKSTPVYE